MNERLNKQIEFLVEIDKLKTILRQTILVDRSRRENDAEHSWHFAMAALILSEYMDPSANMLLVLKLALIHDLVEIYAGDTFAYDPEAAVGKEAREEEAAQTLFGKLPEDQREEYLNLWHTYEAMDTPEARFANAIDRFQPFLNNVMTDGHTWKLGNVCRTQVYTRMQPIHEYVPALWPFIEHNIAQYCQKGILRDE